MRIRRLGVPIAMAVGLVMLVGATVGIIVARGQAPQSATSEAAGETAALPLRAAKTWDQQQQPATYSDPLERNISGRVPVATREVAETVKRSAGADQAVEKNSAYSEGNGAPPDGAVGGNIPQKAQLKYPNLGSKLNSLVVQVEEGAASTRDAEDGAGGQGRGPIAVTVHLSGNVADVVGFLEDNGADPRNVGEDYIEAYVPVRLLGELSEQTGVLRVREIIPSQEDR